MMVHLELELSIDGWIVFVECIQTVGTSCDDFIDVVALKRLD